MAPALVLPSHRPRRRTRGCTSVVAERGISLLMPLFSAQSSAGNLQVQAFRRPRSSILFGLVEIAVQNIQLANAFSVFKASFVQECRFSPSLNTTGRHCPSAGFGRAGQPSGAVLQVLKSGTAFQGVHAMPAFFRPIVICVIRDICASQKCSLTVECRCRCVC